MSLGASTTPTVWGFHVHMELPGEEFQKSLLVQDACREYLEGREVKIDAMDVMKKGYGPHLEEMWELRVETQKDNVLGHLGHIIAFMAVNRGQLPAYIHPVMHDVTLPGIQQLKQEGETNQQQSLWFGVKVDQLQDFFFNPPLTENGDIVDTRSSRIYTEDEIKNSKQQGLESLLAERSTRITRSQWATVDPVDVVHGFHFHAEFSPETSEKALQLQARFLAFLKSNDVVPTSTDVHKAGDYLPLKNACWVVKLESDDCFSIFGEAIAWCMCNRGDIPLYFLCKTWEGQNVDYETLVAAHQNNSLFLEISPEFVDSDLAMSATCP
eukprot:TRINITY_DN1109_c0_g3_i1.p1 TRINITY_DN1109_c0_g3~~TRINITY_DN1109_c0_g3_i1.p1  ORF type:complete len:325 (+),score=66.74 TRINITY_DN1109_c0_g3_i1:57-1031(+)